MPTVQNTDTANVDHLEEEFEAFDLHRKHEEDKRMLALKKDPTKWKRDRLQDLFDTLPAPAVSDRFILVTEDNLADVDARVPFFSDDSSIAPGTLLCGVRFSDGREGVLLWWPNGITGLWRSGHWHFGDWEPAVGGIEFVEGGFDSNLMVAATYPTAALPPTRGAAA